ncbi:MAG: TonB family protein [Gemmatimonadetes bacterium]|nr:TonB family protein [Gemmatimonadota bacterium]
MAAPIFTGKVQPAPDRRAGFAALSLLLHGLGLALLILLTGRGPAAVPGGGIGLGAGGGGGGEMHLVYLPRSAPPPPPPEPEVPAVIEVQVELVVPTPIVEPEVMVTPDSVPTSALARPAYDVAAGAGASGVGAGTGTGAGPGAGTGSGGGTGDGIGPGSGSGRGPGQGGGEVAGRPPRLRMLRLPRAPRSMHGKSVAVRLVVESTGVVSDVELISETGDDDFDDDIRRTVLAWQFHPGTDAAGQVVRTAYEVVLSF